MDTLGILKDTLHQLPMHNRFLLQYVISFFQLIVAEQAGILASLSLFLEKAFLFIPFPENKMSSPNLAIVFGPTLLGSSNGASMLNDFANNQKIIDILITSYDGIFLVFIILKSGT